MVPLIIFVALLIIMATLVIYAFIDNRNKYYGNIVAVFIASLIALFLAIIISVGTVQYDPNDPRIELENETTTEWYCLNGTELEPVIDPTVCDDLQLKTIAFNYTLSYPQCYYCDPPVVQDLSVGFILMLFSIAGMLYSFLMLYDAYLEYKKEQETL